MNEQELQAEVERLVGDAQAVADEISKSMPLSRRYMIGSREYVQSVARLALRADQLKSQLYLIEQAARDLNAAIESRVVS